MSRAHLICQPLLGLSSTTTFSRPIRVYETPCASRALHPLSVPCWDSQGPGKATSAEAHKGERLVLLTSR